MPTYKMKCILCDYVWEAFVPLAEYEKGIKCPKCKTKQTKQLLTPTPVIFKGGGWSK